MDRVAQQAGRFTAFEFCPKVPCSVFWRVSRIRAQNTKKSHGGNRGFFLWVEGQLPDLSLLNILMKLRNPSVRLVGRNTRNPFSLIFPEIAPKHRVGSIGCTRRSANNQLRSRETRSRIVRSGSQAPGCCGFTQRGEDRSRVPLALS